MDPATKDMLAKIDELLAVIDLYLPNRTCRLRCVLTDGSPEDLPHSDWRQRTVGGLEINGVLGNDPRQVWAELGDTVYRFSAIAGHDMVKAVERLPDATHGVWKKLWVYWQYTTEGTSEKHCDLGRFEGEFTLAIDEALRTIISSGLVRLPWPNGRRVAWQVFLLRLAWNESIQFFGRCSYRVRSLTQPI